LLSFLDQNSTLEFKFCVQNLVELDDLYWFANKKKPYKYLTFYNLKLQKNITPWKRNTLNLEDPKILQEISFPVCLWNNIIIQDKLFFIDDLITVQNQFFILTHILLQKNPIKIKLIGQFTFVESKGLELKIKSTNKNFLIEWSEVKKIICFSKKCNICKKTNCTNHNTFYYKTHNFEKETKF
jgi:hypothetical protein